jgi:crotonobetainyl-CoA:carnitine CoA-transferase CaiB-like acyl-CoA transferase
MPSDLEGLFVVSIEQAVAAPYCSSRLADAGARVVKVERPEGDFARRYDRYVKGQSSYFVWLNRGKESITLDLRNADDQAVLRAMLARADVVIQNLAPGGLTKLGFGSATLRAAQPRLITCDISGYGEDGPYRDMKAYDLLVQAETGLASVTGGPDGPARVGVSVCDIAAGMYSHTAILQALYARERTGQGRGIQVSLFSGMADWMNVPYLQRRYGGFVPPRTGVNHPTLAPYGRFACRDGDILFSVQNEGEWVRLCEMVLGEPALAREPRYADPTSRLTNRAALDAHIGAVLSTRPRAEVAAALRRADMAFGLINDVDGLISHPQLKTITYATPEGEVSVIAPASAIVGDAPSYRPVPSIGQHGDSLRREFLHGRAS